ncbi:MAG: MBL fold metallo-hydrolase [Chloroflexi bacterium]|nr:MBL fold metallo-hydrolase [Chloroflexota bacterium]
MKASSIPSPRMLGLVGGGLAWVSVWAAQETATSLSERPASTDPVPSIQSASSTWPAPKTGFPTATGLLSISSLPSQPEFTEIRPLTNREIALKLTAPKDLSFRLDTSTNLLEWFPSITLPKSTGSLAHTDSAAPYLLSRFYRAIQLTATNVMTGDHLVTENGDVVIHPINHASFVMSWNGMTIYNDPVGGTTPYQGLPRADLILVTHSHGDHYHSATLNAVRGSNVVIIAAQAVYNDSGMASLRSSTIVLTNGATTNVLGIKIEAVPAYNPNHPRGTGNGYVLTMGGKRLYLSGDTGDTPEMRAVPNIDVAFVCMNVPYTMSVSQAASVIRAFRPRIVYPYHFRNQDSTYANFTTFKQQLGTDLGIEVRVRKWY